MNGCGLCVGISMDSLSADVARGHEGFTAFYDAEVIGQVRSATLIVGSRTAAQDVVHDAFIALLSRWSELDEPGPYLQRTVVNGCRDLLRRRSVADRFAHRLAPPADVAAVDADLFDASRRLRRTGSTTRPPGRHNPAPYPAETGGALAINEVSEWADPLLYAASTGADITGYALDTTTGWSGTSTSSPYGTITFVVWSPRPGVLLEIASTDPGRSIDDLVQLANDTSVIPATEWDDTYPG